MRWNAGGRPVGIVDEAAGTPVDLLLLHPTGAAERPVRLGPYPADLAWDAEPAQGTFPLVVVSHGTGSSPLLHRGLAAHLARRGHVVALPAHAGNHRGDDRPAGTAEILAQRPRQLRRAVDVAAAALPGTADPVRVAVVGHSLGGYTALAAAGGRPTAFARETPDSREHPVPVTPDPRVSALVLLAPATPWYLADGALDDVRVPVLMLTGDRDEHTPPWQGEVVTRGVRSPVEHRVVAGAGHFSFLTPFPPEMVRPGFAPAQDPPGFDRAAFHAELQDGVAAFLERVLAPVTPPRG